MHAIGAGSRFMGWRCSNGGAPTSRFFLRTLFATILILGSVIASRHSDATTVFGTILGNTTWSPADSPYDLTGDVTVSASSSLTVQAGTSVIASPFDSLASGISLGKVELTIDGSANFNSTSANPIQIAPQAGQTVNSWFGVVVPSGGTMDLSSGRTMLGGGLQLDAGSTLAVAGGAQLSVTGAVTLGGTFQLQSNPLLTAVGTTINVLDLKNAPSVTGTFSGLPEGGTFKVNDVTWQASYGGGSGLSLRAINVDIPSPPAPGGGGGGGGGSSCGPGAGTSLSGSLNSSTTFACGGSPYRLTGDVTVPKGTTLTVQPGVSIVPAASDSLAAGTDTAKVEIAVNGVMILQSAKGATTHIGPASTGVDGWTGLIVKAGGVLNGGNGGVIDGKLQFADGAQFLDGISDAADFDPISVGGDLHLGGTLGLSFGTDFHPFLGETFDLFDVADGRVLTGIFDGLPQGSDLDFGSFELQISYTAGDGNDVELKVVRAADNVPEPATTALIGSALFGLAYSKWRNPRTRSGHR